jgi:hypothetical protein
MKKHFKIFLFLSIVSLIGGCSKKGCVDNIADNYDSSAKKDDGTCSYSSDLHFYWTYNTSLDFDDYDVYDITIEIDGLIIGTINSANDQFFETGDLNCQNSSLFKIEVDLGSSKSSTINFNLTDQDGYDVDSGSTIVEAGMCHYVEVIY